MNKYSELYVRIMNFSTPNLLEGVNLYFTPRHSREPPETVPSLIIKNRDVLRICDLALYSPEEQKEKWHDWCDAYFSALGET